MFGLNTNDVASGILIFAVIVIVIALVFREVICWYWKINRNIALLIEIRDLLAAILRGLPLPDSQDGAQQSQASTTSAGSVRSDTKVSPAPLNERCPECGGRVTTSNGRAKCVQCSFEAAR